MDQFLEVLKSSNFDSRIYLRHLWGYISKKNFWVPGRTGHGDTDLQNPSTAQKCSCSCQKKINVPESILLKFVMHDISK